VFGISKALKMWVISTLGVRWTFRVLVLPGAPLISRGPYAIMRHPNYVAVLGEIIGFAMIVGAPFTGAAALIVYGVLLKRKISVEDRALGRK
jgi:methyltransferase